MRDLNGLRWGNERLSLYRILLGDCPEKDMYFYCLAPPSLLYLALKEYPPAGDLERGGLYPDFGDVEKIIITLDIELPLVIPSEVLEKLSKSERMGFRRNKKSD